VVAGAAELIVDITSTGATLDANNLKIVSDGVILKSEAQLAAGLKAPWTPDQVETVRFFLRTIEARARAKGLAALNWPAGQAPAAESAVRPFLDKGASSGAEGLLTPMKTLFDAANALAEAGIGPSAASRPDYVFEPDCVAADTLAARLGFSTR
jgi:ATP phosphoribosyltransferase